MIFWPFIKSYEFEPKWGEKIQLTKGLNIKYSPFTSGGTLQPKVDFQIWVGDDKHYQITRNGGAQVSTTIKITRNKKVVKISLADGWEQSYYLKTPWIWKLK